MKFISSTPPQLKINKKNFAGSIRVFLTILLFLYLLLIFVHSIRTPVDGNDFLEYAAQGKALHKTQRIEFKSLLIDPETGTYRAGFHAPGFSLLLTWEKIVDSLFGQDTDLYFRSISSFYGILILALLYFWLSKKSKWLAVLGILGLLSTQSFFHSVLYAHIDTYRIYFLMISWIYTARLMEDATGQDSVSLLLFAVSSGLAAFAHSLGALIAVITISVLILFLKSPFRHKIKTGLVIISIALFSGGIHYLIDTLWGRGWILGISW